MRSLQDLRKLTWVKDLMKPSFYVGETVPSGTVHIATEQSPGY